ncbi:MAG: class IV adenylate cyclase [bacterium]
METEIEAKFADIHTETLRARLKEIGAVLEYPETLMRRRNFDYPDGRLNTIGGWIRIRDEGNKVTLSYKQLNDRTLHGTKEVSVDVSDFDKAADFLTSIGLEAKSYQETKREKWMYQDMEITIDTWPWIPPFMELEGSSEEALKDAAAALGLDWSRAMHGSVETVYQMHYDFPESEIDAWGSITFVPEPDWLLTRKKA